MKLRFFVVSSLFIAVVCVLTICQAANAAKKPNVIFILSDDLGYGDLGSFGQKRIQTPVLDKMAAEGMKMTNFYAGSTVCAPSRCVVMTGYHTGHCFIRGNGKDNLRPSDVTVGEVMKAAGYQTALIGKWGLGHEGSSGVPTKQGFDYFFGYLDLHHAHNYYPSFLVRDEKRVPLKNVVPNEGQYGQGKASVKKEYSHDLLANEALKFIDRAKDNPFFLYLALTIPHANNEAGKEGMEVPDYGIYADKDWPEPQKGHAAMISRMDTDIGRIMDRLKQYGIDDNTLILFSSDNGPHREGGNDPDFQNSNGDLKEIKRSLHEGGIRVPTIARWPGQISAGTSTDHAGGFWDIMATFADVAGSEEEVPEDTDGISFMPSLLGDNNDQHQHDFLYWAFYERGGTQALRKGKWKAIEQPSHTPVRLYDLSQDLGEETDLAAKHPGLVKEFSVLMQNAYKANDKWKFPAAKVKPKSKKQSSKK